MHSNKLPKQYPSLTMMKKLICILLFIIPTILFGQNKAFENDIRLFIENFKNGNFKDLEQQINCKAEYILLNEFSDDEKYLKHLNNVYYNILHEYEELSRYEDLKKTELLEIKVFAEKPNKKDSSFIERTVSVFLKFPDNSVYGLNFLSISHDNNTKIANFKRYMVDNTKDYCAKNFWTFNSSEKYSKNRVEVQKNYSRKLYLIEIFYPNNQLKERYFLNKKEVTKNKKEVYEGKFISYHINGKKHVECEYLNDELINEKYIYDYFGNVERKYKYGFLEIETFSDLDFFLSEKDVVKLQNDKQTVSNYTRKLDGWYGTLSGSGEIKIWDYKSQSGVNGFYIDDMKTSNSRPYLFDQLFFGVSEEGKNNFMKLYRNSSTIPDFLVHDLILYLSVETVDLVIKGAMDEAILNIDLIEKTRKNTNAKYTEEDFNKLLSYFYYLNCCLENEFFAKYLRSKIVFGELEKLYLSQILDEVLLNQAVVINDDFRLFFFQEIIGYRKDVSIIPLDFWHVENTQKYLAKKYQLDFKVNIYANTLDFKYSKTDNFISVTEYLDKYWDKEISNKTINSLNFKLELGESKKPYYFNVKHDFLFFNELAYLEII